LTDLAPEPLQVTADTIQILESIANDHNAKPEHRISAAKELRRIQEAMNPPAPDDRVGATIHVLVTHTGQDDDDVDAAAITHVDTVVPFSDLSPEQQDAVRFMYGKQAPDSLWDPSPREPSHSGRALEKERTARLKNDR
jgi:hypothetical protein